LLIVAMTHRMRDVRALCSAVISTSRNTFPESSTEARCPSNAAHLRKANRSEAAATDCATHRRLQLMYDRSHWRRRRIRQQPRMQSSSARRAWAAEAPSVQRHPLAAPRADRYTFTFDCRSSRTEGLCEFKPGD
jgi:hypothetical protein